MFLKEQSMETPLALFWFSIQRSLLVTVLQVLSNPFLSSAVKNPSQFCFQIRYMLLLRHPMKPIIFQCGRGSKLISCKDCIKAMESLVQLRSNSELSFPAPWQISKFTKYPLYKGLNSSETKPASFP